MAEESIAGKIGGAGRGRVEIALIGCNHRTAPVELRERVSFSPEQAVRAAAELCQSGVLAEAVVVSTCNRSELYGVTAEPSDQAPRAMASYFTAFHRVSPAEMDGRLYRHAGTEAVRHLFRVSSGLDSMLLGEAEILGQVRDAYRRALDSGSTGPVLNRLFQGALEVGKRVRTETEIGARPMSVALAGVKLAERVFGNLKGHRALIVGAGAVAEQVVEHLRARGIGELRVVNRSSERAQELARRMGGEAVDWGALENLLAAPDIVVTSVSGADPILTRAALERAMATRSGRAMFLVDLGVPRNVESSAAELYSVYLFNIDNLGEIVEQNRKTREEEIPRAEAIIAEHLTKFLAWQRGLEAAGLLDDLSRRLEAERQALLNEHFGSIPGEDRERLERLTRTLVERILRLPSDRLRQARKLRREIEGLSALRDLFGLDEEKP